MIIENKKKEFEYKETKLYFESEGLSQSKLKLLLLDPKKFNEVKEQELYFEENKHFLIGSAVDFLFNYIILESLCTFGLSENASQTIVTKLGGG